MSRELSTQSVHRRLAGGFTLVEILVTILVISIGLLGVAGLHSFSLRNNYAEPELDDASSRALVDVAEWKDTLGAQLPDGDGSIAVDQDTRTVTIVIQWGERGMDMTFTTETEV
jgi:prepilin-type N-terminal cleavage/methylation domain-containing protein